MPERDRRGGLTPRLSFGGPVSPSEMPLGLADALTVSHKLELSLQETCWVRISRLLLRATEGLPMFRPSNED